MDPSFLRLHSESEFTRAPRAPRFFIAPSVPRFTFGYHAVEFGIWLLEGIWRPYGRFFFQRKAVAFWKDQHIGRGVLRAGRNRTIRRVGAQVLVRYPGGKLAIDFQTSRQEVSFRWRWLGEECALVWSQPGPRRSDVREVADLTLGAQRLQVVLFEPAALITDAGSGGDLPDLFWRRPSSNLPSEWIEPVGMRIDRENAHVILLLVLMLRGFYAVMDDD